MTRALATAVLAVAVGVSGCGSDSRIDKARGVLDDGGRFETGRSGGAAFARVTSLLRAEAEDCVDDRGLDDVRCATLLEASAYAQVTAVAMRRCTRPVRDDARRDAARYLDRVADTTGDDNRPQPPVPPNC